MNESDTSSDQPEFPQAEIKTHGGVGQRAQMVVSRLWIATALCVVIAAGLTYWQIGGRGPLIEVQFTEGYGLQAGDPVRYRGITVGEVSEIVLDDTLESVIVRIRLATAAANIAREGARFWIERPNISIGQVQGLDTLVGGRYVGVLPGPADGRLSQLFYGLDVASAPVSNIVDGLEVTLESKDRFGLQAGSPVIYRGITVGQILSVGLTNDAVSVEARAYIEPEYRQLVRANTRFWSNSGLDVKIGFSGIELDAGTLATIAAGGVAFATPTVVGSPASTGQRFELFKSPREEWLAWQPRVAIGNATLPQGVVTPRPVLGIRRQRGALGALGAGRERGWLLQLDDGRLLGPANVLTGEEGEEYQLEVGGQSSDLPLDNLDVEGLLAAGHSQQPNADLDVVWSLDKLRVAKDPEEIVITCGNAEQTLPISAQRLEANTEGWIIDPSVPLDDSWHGATVIAASDGNVVGVLIRHEERAWVALLTKKLLEPKLR